MIIYDAANKRRFRDLKFVGIAFISVLFIKTFMILLNLTLSLSKDNMEKEFLFLYLHNFLIFILQISIISFFILEIFFQRKRKIDSTNEGYNNICYICSGPILMILSGIYCFMINIKGCKINEVIEDSDSITVCNILLFISIYNIIIYEMEKFIQKMEKMYRTDSDLKKLIRKILK